MSDAPARARETSDPRRPDASAHRAERSLPLVAVAGNPNTGKTSIFNRLTGQDLKVGNYPGVTVERHEGGAALPDGREVRLLDVPGSYSLSARSAEEQIAVRAIAGLPPEPPPDLVIVVVDATQLTRNLYFVLQVLEFGVPTVIALNMVDMLEDIGQEVDAAALQRRLGVPVVPVSGLHGTGMRELRQVIARTLDAPSSAVADDLWTPSDPLLEADIEATAEVLPEAWHRGSERRRRALALWALLSLDEDDELTGIPDELRAVVVRRLRLAEASGRELEREIIEARYRWIDGHAAEFLRQRGHARTWTERADAVLLHPVFGFAVFLLLMGIVFQSLFSWSDPAIGAIEAAFDRLAGLIEVVLPAGILRDFLTEGVIAGVGSVVVFLPQILMLFFFIGILEDTGYMARVAFLMDRIMRRFGLHGRAFVPMMSGFACAVPAILATRTMERRRDRMLTMMVVPLMTCSARLPVYTLLIAAFFPPDELFGILPVQGLLMVAMYVFSTLVAFVALAVLGKTLFRGREVPLLLELPPYRRPLLRSVLRMMWNRAKLFLTEAGRVILACTVVLWFLLSFPRVDAGPEASEADHAAAAAQQLAESYGARIGKALEPALEPLGFDWKIGIGLVGAFAAREVFVSTLGVVYGVGEDVDEGSSTLREKLRRERDETGRPVYTPLVALSLMVFFALACQCMSTLAVVRRETASWRWPIFLFAYMGVLAWLASFAVYQGGRLLGLE